MVRAGPLRLSCFRKPPDRPACVPPASMIGSAMKIVLAALASLTLASDAAAQDMPPNVTEIACGMVGDLAFVAEGMHQAGYPARDTGAYIGELIGKALSNQGDATDIGMRQVFADALAAESKEIIAMAYALPLHFDERDRELSARVLSDVAYQSCFVNLAGS